MLLLHPNYQSHQKRFASQYPELGLSSYKIVAQDRTSFYAINEAKKDLIVVFRGTDKNNADDLLNDGAILIGRAPGRVPGAVEKVKALMAKFPGYTVTITGHSLGGTIAEEVAVRIGSRVHGISTGSSPLKPSRLHHSDCRSLQIT